MSEPETPSKISGEIVAPGGPEPRPRSSGDLRASDSVRASSLYRLSGIFDPRRKSGPGSSFSSVAPLRRRGLRRRSGAMAENEAPGPVCRLRSKMPDSR